MFSVEAFLDGVQGAGPDIAEDDADRSGGKKKKFFVEPTRRGNFIGRRGVTVGETR